MSTWQDEQNTARDITRQMAGMVADHLDGFKVDMSVAFSDHRGVYLDGPDGSRLFLALDWRNADRVEISGVYPRHQAYGVERYKIGVGRTRGPVVIAREITRRLLPGYLTELARVRADVDEHATMRDKRQTVATEFAALVGGTVDKIEDSSTQSRIRWFHSSGENYGNANIDYRGDSVSIDIRSLPVGVARQVFALIGGAR